MTEERLEILKMLESGQIGAEEAATLLAALDESPALEPAEVAAPALVPEERQENRWARFWIYPMMAGGVVLILGALVIGLVYATGAARGWSVCGWLPVLLGLGIVVLAIWTRRATWLHLRISKEGKQKIAFSFPLPLTLAAWAVRIAQPFVPQLQETGVDDLIIALRDSAGQGEPLFIDVQDEEDGERVQIYIG
jgi:MFS family permease